jgi:hypothetical protein
MFNVLSLIGWTIELIGARGVCDFSSGNDLRRRVPPRDLPLWHLPVPPVVPRLRGFGLHAAALEPLALAGRPLCHAL